MRKQILILALSFIVMVCYSKENNDTTKRTKEFLLTSSSLSFSDLGLQFKIKMVNQTFLRMGLANLYLDYISNTPKSANSYPSTNSVYGINLIFGLENRKFLTDKFMLTYGFDIITNYEYSKSTIDNPNIAETLRTTKYFNFNPGFGLNLGGIVKINNNLFFGAEMTPQVLYSKRDLDKTTGSKVVVTNCSINTKKVTIMLIYRLN